VPSDLPVHDRDYLRAHLTQLIGVLGSHVCEQFGDADTFSPSLRFEKRRVLILQLNGNGDHAIERS
jgi:hypothetical protein